MLETFILIAGFVFVTLVNPVLAIILSLAASVSVPLAEVLNWLSAAHDAQAATYLSQFL